MINLHRGVFALQRTECKFAAFQTLLPDRKSVTVPGEHFDTATPAIEEQNQMLGQQLDSNSTAKYPATIRQRPLKIFRMSVGLVRRRREKSRRQRSQCVGLSLHLNNCSQNPPQQSTVDACVDPERRDAGQYQVKIGVAVTCELDRDDRMWLESLNLIKFLPPLIKTGDRDVLGLAKRLERQGTGTLVTQALGKNLTTWRDHLDPMSSRKPINRMPARIIPAAIALDGGRVEGPSSKAAEHQKMKAFGRDCRFLNRLKVVVKYPGRRPTSKLDTDPPVPKPDVHMFIFSNDSRKNLGP